MSKSDQLELKKDDKEGGETGCDCVPNTKSQLLALTHLTFTLCSTNGKNSRPQLQSSLYPSTPSYHRTLQDHKRQRTTVEVRMLVY